MSSGATADKSRLSWCLHQACRVFWHLYWHGSWIFPVVCHIFVRVMLESSFKCLEGFVVCAFLLHTEESYIMRINTGSKSVWKLKHSLRGFRIRFSYASFTWKWFWNLGLWVLSLITNECTFSPCGVISVIMFGHKFNSSVGSSIINTLKSVKSFNCCSKCSFLYESFSLLSET